MELPPAFPVIAEVLVRDSVATNGALAPLQLMGLLCGEAVAVAGKKEEEEGVTKKGLQRTRVGYLIIIIRKRRPEIGPVPYLSYVNLSVCVVS